MAKISARAAARLRAEQEAVSAEVTMWHAERKRWYPVREDGARVQAGDEITHFRGEAYRFGMVTAFPEGASEGKITYTKLDGSPVFGGECYPSVFGLKLVREQD